MLAALRTHIVDRLGEILAAFRPTAQHLVVTDLKPGHGRAFLNPTGDPVQLDKFVQSGHLSKWQHDDNGVLTLWVPVEVQGITWGRELHAAPGQWVHLQGRS